MACFLLRVDVSLESLDMYDSFGTPTEVRKLVRDHWVCAFRKLVRDHWGCTFKRGNMEYSNRMEEGRIMGQGRLNGVGGGRAG